MNNTEKTLIASTMLFPYGASVVARKINPEVGSTPEVKTILRGIIDLATKKSEVNLANLSAITGIEQNVLNEINLSAEVSQDFQVICEAVIRDFRISAYGAIGASISRIAVSTSDPEEKWRQIQDMEAKRQKQMGFIYTEGETQAVKQENWLKKLDTNVKNYRKGILVPGISTGFSDFDRATGGYLPGELIIFGATPSVGKTQFLLHEAMIAANLKIAMGVVSCEQGFNAIWNRLTAYESNINSISIRDGSLSDADLALIHQAHGSLTAKQLFIEDEETNLEPIMSKIIDWVYNEGVKIVGIDYLQLVKYSRYRERRIEVGEIARELKFLAKKLQIPVILLSQLTRSSGRPKMSDLKESGDIEAHGDKICLLNKETEGVHFDWVKVKDGSLVSGIKSVNRATGRFGDLDDPNIGFATPGYKTPF